MKLESQVASLELSKRLDELGVKRDSLFIWSERYWTKESININAEIRSYITFKPSRFPTDSIAEYPAYTVAELGEMLLKVKEIFEQINKYGFSLYEKYEDMYFGRKEITTDMNEANSRARTVIHLIENGYVKVEELNDDR